MEWTSLIIRKASASDEPFLREMLYHSLYVPEGHAPFDRDILNRPDIAKYVKGWGRSGDLGLIGVDASSGQAVGAVWVRNFTASERGYGYVADNIPELGIAVLPEHRGRGVGSALLQRLVEMAGAAYDAVSLSVSMDNPARRLYERVGFEGVGASGNSLTMLKRLKSADSAG
ncbi:MAG TPA: GNAT family N-acetyltransferase [Terriglobia bacterium]|nr:GNAT family N-acetyltransferase [Terriglobia bacterium]